MMKNYQLIKYAFGMNPQQLEFNSGHIIDSTIDELEFLVCSVHTWQVVKSIDELVETMKTFTDALVIWAYAKKDNSNYKITWYTPQVNGTLICVAYNPFYYSLSGSITAKLAINYLTLNHKGRLVQHMPDHAYNVRIKRTKQAHTG